VARRGRKSWGTGRADAALGVGAKSMQNCAPREPRRSSASRNVRLRRLCCGGHL
jgi:hypothetical protein